MPAALPAPANTPASLLVSGLGLSVPGELMPVAIPSGGACCPITGRHLTEGYPVQSVIPDSTGEWLDLLRGGTHGYLSPEATAAIKGDWNLGNRAIFQRSDGAASAYFPLLARPKLGEKSTDDAAGDEPDTSGMSSKKLKTFSRDGRLPRPCWSDLAREVWPARAGEECFLLLATDPKKRVWNRGRVGRLGGSTPVLLFDSSRHLLRCASVSWPRLLECLTLVENVYTAGFTKAAIAECLYREAKAMQAAGAAQTMAWERALSSAWRGSDEFTMSVIIAQKHA